MGGWRIGRRRGMQKKRLCGEADDVSLTTIEAWIERLSELYQGYEPQNILNLDKLGLFFKALPEKGLAEKKKVKAEKKSKQQMAAMLIVVADGSFLFEPIVIWQSKLP